jgi:hypothetical protein
VVARQACAFELGSTEEANDPRTAESFDRVLSRLLTRFVGTSR